MNQQGLGLHMWQKTPLDPMASDCMLQKCENNAAAGAIHSKMSEGQDMCLEIMCMIVSMPVWKKKRKPPLNVPKYWK